MTETPWQTEIERLSAQIQLGEFASAEATARDLQEKRAALTDWPPEDLGELRLHVFNPKADQSENAKLGKWVDSLNRLMHKLLEGEFHEVARVTGIMKRYAEPYTPLIHTQETPARNLPGLTCRLSARPH